MQLPDRTISSALDSGERVLWSGRPSQGFAFSGADAFLIPFGLIFTIAALVWMGIPLFAPGTSEKPPPPFFALIALPHLAVGLYVVAGRHFLDRYYRSGLHYAITDRRILIVSTKVLHRIQSLDLSAMRPLRLDEMPGGVGTIHMTEEQNVPGFMRYGGLSMFHTTLGQAPFFFRVKDAKRAYGILIEEMRARSK